MPESDVLNKAIGRRIAAARQARGMTQGELGKALEPAVKKQAISDIEVGTAAVTVPRLAQISKIVDRPIEAFVRDLPGDRPDVSGEGVHEKAPVLSEP